MAADRTLGTRIKRARERQRMTQYQLADALGVTQKTVDNWEHDKSVPKSALGALEHVLGERLDTGAPPVNPLPARYAAYEGDEEVMVIWNSSLGFATRINLIEALLEIRERAARVADEHARRQAEAEEQAGQAESTPRRTA